MKHLFSGLWLLMSFLLLVVFFVPVSILVAEYLQPFSLGLAVALAVRVSASIYFSVFFLILACAVFVRILPRNRAGKFRMFQDAGSIIWAFNTYFPGIVLKIFQPLLFLNDWTRNYILWALCSKVHPSATITSTTRFSDPDMVEVGENAFISEYSSIGPSFLPKPKELIVAPVKIGNNSFVGAAAKICAGCTIADDVFIGHHVFVSPFVKIGENSKIGPNSYIDFYVKIGKNVVIGSHCKISKRRRIADNEEIPDGAVI